MATTISSPFTASPAGEATSEVLASDDTTPTAVNDASGAAGTATAGASAGSGNGSGGNRGGGSAAGSDSNSTLMLLLVKV